MSNCSLFHKIADHIFLFSEKRNFGKTPVSSCDAITIFQMLKLTEVCVPLLEELLSLDTTQMWTFLGENIYLFMVGA